MPNFTSDVRFDKVSVDQTLPLRQSVLWPNMPLSQVRLPEDESGTHYGAFLPHQDSPVAVISLFIEDIPIDREKLDLTPSRANTAGGRQAVRFRKFACDPEYQGKGIGTKLLLYSLSMARSEHDVTMAWCDARTATLEWYRRRGLIPFGVAFYKGAVEYTRMKTELRDISFRAEGS